MAMNKNPVFGGTPQNEWDAAGALLAANTAKDGTGTVQTIFTVSVDGAFIEKIVCRTRGTNVASVLRIFVNNGGVNTVAANNKLIDEISLPATTLSEVAAQPEIVKNINLRLQGNYRLICCIGTTVAAGWDVSAHGSEYAQI